MLITVCMIKREPEITAHVGAHSWIDIDELHIELSIPQMNRIKTTIDSATKNPERTIHAQW